MALVELSKDDLIELRLAVRVAEGEGAMDVPTADDLYDRLSNILFLEKQKEALENA